MFKKICLCVFLFSSVATADTISPAVPALYSIINVGADDTLNVRTKPDASGDILGGLTYNAQGIEVVGFSHEGNWAKINFLESAGWISMNFLSAEPRANGMPDLLRCFGTEPFWFVRATGDSLMLNDMEISEDTSEHTILYTSPSPDFLNLAETGILFNWQSNGRGMSSYVLPGQCSDGMSDRSFALHYYDEAGRIGCCSISE